MAVVKPILRIFDYDKAVEFYVNWLGFQIDWKHQPDGSPLYMQVSLRDVMLYLSEHHGDSSPGAHIFIEDFAGLRAYQKNLVDQEYKYNRPGLEIPDWNPNAITVTVHDPFGNRLTFVEEIG
ncbi:glyoxalase superfamily protein [Mucilaginibacter dorajii]|uniref:Bleomycin resistance protein n=1 Tax=Mucilaginibacter dorajii TaxID=692994 RepID=A0ABP7PZG4_9SPHI|nr:glyoxalase superfamily protein [Mucilaginibacter dorajii]MCS3732979.1 catechol 2,3-dioxygenase-like lactoylglutathione lyase family enzyme [Mucilaginibacter dorajii]